MSLPALDGDVDRLSIKAFLPWADCLSLTDTGVLLVPPGSTTKVGGDAPAVGLVATQTDLVPYTKTFV